jgi:hypothetical protein
LRFITSTPRTSANMQSEIIKKLKTVWMKEP